MKPLKDQKKEINRFFLELAGRVIEARQEGATELTIRLPKESTDFALKVAALFKQTGVRATVRAEVMLIIEWDNRPYN